MKKENIFLAATFIIPIIFVLSMWGYYTYYSGKLNPQYDFVYVAPYNNPDFGYKDNKPNVYNPFEIQDNGELKIVNCPTEAPNSVANLPPTGDNQNFSTPYQQNNCSNIIPKNLTYYRLDIKNKTSKQIDFDTFKSTKFTKGFESSDGYKFNGDISSQPDYSSSFGNPFAYSSSKFGNATLTDKSGASISFELKENPYNRLFVGWIKN